MNATTLTDRQAKVLKFIASRPGSPPVLFEIAQAVGLTMNEARSSTKALEAKGYVHQRIQPIISPLGFEWLRSRT